MSSVRQLKLEEKTAANQRQVILELNSIVKDIERSEKIILALNRELETVNTKYQGPRSTREDVAYLTSLLECAKRKLAWEKQINSLQKRTPLLMERMSAVINDPKGPPPAQLQEQMMQALRSIQAAMERLQSANTSADGECKAELIPLYRRFEPVSGR
jgi:hypothetical protein